jgi:hypothetical protein
VTKLKGNMTISIIIGSTGQGRFSEKPALNNVATTMNAFRKRGLSPSEEESKRRALKRNGRQERAFISSQECNQCPHGLLGTLFHEPMPGVFQVGRGDCGPCPTEGSKSLRGT